jgi:hypothetical protein
VESVKALVFLALVTTVFGQRVYGPSRVGRDGTNLVVTSLSNSFAAALEEAYGDTPLDDPDFVSWHEISASYDACPAQHVFRVPIQSGARLKLYRIRLVDNGVVPTPFDVRTYKNQFGRQVYIGWPLLFQCNDDNVQSFDVFRSDNGWPFVKVGSVSGNRPWWGETNLPPGGYSFRIQAVVGTNSSFYQTNEAYVTIP